MVYVVHPRCYETKPSTYIIYHSTTVSLESVLTVSQFNQSQAKKGLPEQPCSILVSMVDTFVVLCNQLKEQMLKCGL